MSYTSNVPYLGNSTSAVCHWCCGPVYLLVGENVGLLMVLEFVSLAFSFPLDATFRNF